ncbi:DUF1772 domain-containing protein [Streptomyces sp. 8K308]|uniref:DUF1772 domain-containing protein n=1 Tax=Streptomyces sp. 8K308 TaxID=2530388 RepID=UPI001045766A|nr:DUF1772 domain-containing protein [Streptomyces sp. 8K308]TDC03693.1 DUF1772 domain-containing protein [Streptomyces sp. 8K308]
MNILIHVLPGIAVLTCSAVYGADLFATIVLRPALSEVDDRTLTTTMGHVHKYGDQRLPLPFVLSVVTSILSGAAALVAGRTAVALASLLAAAALLCWISIYFRVSAPINRAIRAAAAEKTALPNVRTLQQRWDRVVPLRLSLQATAVAALCTALALA